MEIKEFFKLLAKYKTVLVTVPLITIIVSFFLVRNLADEYISSGQIATGLADQTKQLLDPISSTLQEARVYGEFSNLIEAMKLKKMMDMVSYKLMLHDLTSPAPFRKPGKLSGTLSNEARKRAIAVFQNKLDSLKSLSLYNTYEAELYDMLMSVRYDERSLRKAINITRDENSDFISVDCTSENPQLSAFIVNTLIQGFIAYRNGIVKENQEAAISYLKQLVEDKRKVLQQKTDELQQYKVRNGVLNLEEQSRSIATQISENQDKLLQAQKDIDSYRGAINGIDKKFDPSNRKYADARVTKLNTAITASQEQLRILDDKYVRSGFDPKLKASVDSLQRRITEQMNQTSDQYITNPLVGKEDLVKQKNTLEVNYDLARNSVTAIRAQLNKLNSQFNKLVPLDATVKTYEFAIEVASKEYQDALAKYNLTNLQTNTSSKLMQVEVATPEVAQPSKKMLLVILGGIISFVFCIVVLFVVFYMDDTIKNPVQLANVTNLPVLGVLNQISGTSIDLRKLWDIEHRGKMQQFKDLLRAIRFEIDQELNGDKVLAITSMNEGEGKTLLAISLAYSYSMINKKVLLIDGNFDNPTISETVKPKVFLEDIFKNTSETEKLSNNISVLGNHAADITLLEVGDEHFIQSKFNELKQIYDIILIEAPSISSMNKAKEWLLFADKYVAVFAAGQNIADSKKQYVKYLQSTGSNFAGWVLNKAITREGLSKK